MSQGKGELSSIEVLFTRFSSINIKKRPDRYKNRQANCITSDIKFQRLTFEI